MEKIEPLSENKEKKIDWYTIVDDIIKEDNSAIITDAYAPWSSIDQLQVWLEVKKPKEITGTIDTSDSWITKVMNTYRLSVPNPDGKIFSLWIDWNDKTFKIGYFWNTALAYSTLESQLQSWLWSAYILSYDTWTYFDIERVDQKAISTNSPNLVRDITLSDFETESLIDVIVDWTTVQLDWATHSWSASTAITYLETQLSSSTYYMNDNSNVLTIARIDWAIPVITSTEYDRYTYRMNYEYADTPASWQYLDYCDSTINWTDYRFYEITATRAFDWDEIIRNLWGYELDETWINSPLSSATGSISYWISITARLDWQLKSITKISSCTATRAILKSSWWTTLATASFSWDVASFDYTITSWTTYLLQADNDWANYTVQFWQNLSVVEYDLFSYNIWNPTYNIDWCSIEPAHPTWFTTSVQFNKSSWWSDSTWTSANKSVYFNETHYLYINETDYSAITFDSNNHYTDPWSFPDDSAKYSLTTTNHKATIATTTHTEITITSSLLTNAYKIFVWMNIRKIELEAVASWWSSLWEWTAEWQSCTTKYWTTTTIVDDKIFKTDATNYWNIYDVKLWSFIIQWTTDTSNKLNYTCT